MDSVDLRELIEYKTCQKTVDKKVKIGKTAKGRNLAQYQLLETFSIFVHEKLLKTLS